MSVAQSIPNKWANSVLVVEDDRDVREAVMDALVDAGFVVTSASDGRSALASLKTLTGPCLMLLDLMMPDMTGDQVWRAALGMPESNHVRMVVMSASSDGEGRARELGAIDYLRKPMDLDELLAVVGRHCNSGG